jgi:predicted metal-dependent hydrolase
VATKQVIIPEIGTITLSKRKSTRSIRLKIDARGQVSVTMPFWLPYEAGVQFARSRQEWISQHQQDSGQPLAHGQIIGMSHRLVFEASPVAQKITSRVDSTVVRVTHPSFQSYNDQAVQAVAEKASIRALRSQAEALLPDRLRLLASNHGFDYRSVQVKQLTGRWGSCDSKQNIVLNLYLMQLPWTLIDYVLLHELTHTIILRHGPDFWSAMRHILPDTQVRRKAIKAYRPIVG